MKTIGICTGCGEVIKPGPYFRRRMLRHLNNGWHNHAAMRMVKMRMVKVKMGSYAN